MEITLTEEEVDALQILLSLDMDETGFPDEEQEVLETISEKLTRGSRYYTGGI